MRERPGFRRDVLLSYGAEGAVLDELLAYDENAFAHGPEGLPPIPCPDEPFAAAWEERVRQAQGPGALSVLRASMPQLHFPIREGISGTEDYRAAARRGVPPEALPGATGPAWADPDGIRLLLHPGPGGSIPVIIARDRRDFVTLVRALAMRNEPLPVPDSQGACLVKGFNDWGRVGALRARWESLPEGDRECSTWEEEFRRIMPHPELYQDTFLILSSGPYSAVPAARMGMAEAEWIEASLQIRMEHECTHYFTKRFLGSARNRALDEVVADAAGISLAAGRFRADWLHLFMGLEGPPRFRPGGRLENYRGDPPLSDEAFGILCALVRDAASNLERFATAALDGAGAQRARIELLWAATRLTLEEMASPEGPDLLREGLPPQDPRPASNRGSAAPGETTSKKQDQR